MSGNPLLDQLRDSIPEGGALTLQAFEEFLFGDSGVVKYQDNYFSFDEATGQVSRAYKSTQEETARLKRGGVVA